MNRIIAVCHSLGGDGLTGANVFLASLLKTFQRDRFATIHILHGPTISREHFLAESPLHLHAMPEKRPGYGTLCHMCDLPFYPDDFVMHVDFRDSFFQRFPFSCLDYSFDKVHVFAENSQQPLDKEPNNLLWQRRLHSSGSHLPAFLNGKPVICFGVIGAGRWGLFQQHLRTIVRRIIDTDRFFGLDQAVLTSLVHEHPENYILHSNEDGPVMHLHTQPPVLESRDGKLIIKTTKGIVPAVVHQYDRYPELLKIVHATYSRSG